jgi:two-component system, chemotaxis family, sensor kinase CheA
MINLGKYQAKFLAESRGNLREMGQAVEAVATMNADRDALEPGFRAAHSIKGSASMFGYERLANLAAEVEAVFYALVQGSAQQSRDVAQALSDAQVTCDLMIDCIDTGTDAVTGIEQSVVERLSVLYPKAA